MRKYRQSPNGCRVSCHRRWLLSVCSATFVYLVVLTAVTASSSLSVDLWSDRVRLLSRELRQQEQQQVVVGTQSFRRSSHEFYASLSDVWLCLACALGWTVWIVMACWRRNDSALYDEQAILVRGHVLQVQIVEDSSGIPNYHAVIDYCMDHPASTGNSPAQSPTSTGQDTTQTLQIRKSFQTRKLLRQGFSNVELLALPSEPTSSVLKEDWEYEGRQRRRHKTNSGNYLRSASVVVAGILVGLSLTGAILTVNQVDPTKRTWGWVSVSFIVLFLWPLALAVHAVVRASLSWFRPRNEQDGIIIKGDPPPPPPPTTCDSQRPFVDPFAFFQHDDNDDEEGCLTPRLSNKKISDVDNKEAPPPASSTTATAANNDNKPTSPERQESGCYLIQLPNLRRKRTDSESVAESVSTISSLSLQGWGKTPDRKGIS